MCSSNVAVLLLSSLLLVDRAVSFATTQPLSVRSTLLRATTKSNGEQDMADTTSTTLVGEQEDKDDSPIYFNILSQESPPSAPSVVANNDYSTAAQNALEKTYSTYSVAPLNGWIPKDDYALWGLPGAIAPLGFFDPVGFAREGTSLNDAKRLREAEVQHGRVAMIACVGYIAGEAVQNGPLSITGPANDQLQQMPAPAFAFLTAMIAGAELYRAKKGWVEPKAKIGSNTLWTLRENYYPGDLGFDPLGLKPTENYDFQRMQTKELSNGRLAMIGITGFMAQELVNHKTIWETLTFYFHVYSGDYDGYY